MGRHYCREISNTLISMPKGSVHPTAPGTGAYLAIEANINLTLFGRIPVHGRHHGIILIYVGFGVTFLHECEVVRGLHPQGPV